MARGRNDTFDEEHREECLHCTLPGCVNCFDQYYQMCKEKYKDKENDNNA